MAKIKKLSIQPASSVGYAGPKNDFWFSDDLSKWTGGPNRLIRRSKDKREKHKVHRNFS